MLTKKHLAAAMAGLGVVTLPLTGCTRTESTGPSSSGSALQAVQDRGTLRVGDCLNFAPFGFKDKSGNAVGYDVDIAKAMAKGLGVKLEIVDTSNANRIPNLQTNKVDVVLCNFTRTLDRAKAISFTNPYVVAGQGLLVKNNSPIKTVNDLNGKKVAVGKGTTNADVLTQLGIKATTQEFDTNQASVIAVQQGQVDAMIEDTNFLHYQAKLDPSLRVSNGSVVPLEYNAFGVKLGNQEWVNWLNEFLFEFNASGENTKLYKQWFGVNPPYALNPQY